MRFTQKAIVVAGSMASSINSSGEDMNQMTGASIQAVWTGAPVGTLKLQISNDIVADAVGADQAANVVNWTDYTGSSQTVNGAGDFTYNLLNSGYHWIRLVYTRTSGTGTLNATFSGKGD